ncbi:MAG: acetyl-CoA carboxylase carboxyltransferase subunit alpha [Lentisphaeria bacterium]|nr:acetyl-CoA carboxylase carboxyltransferase subunit alpha [Lentisphaeria bacterium]
MLDTFLDFEAPIAELQKKIAELEKLSDSNKIDVSKETKALKVRLQEMTANIYSNLSPWQRVQLSRHPKRPYTLDYIGKLFPGFMELSGDRRFSDDKAIIGGPARFRGKPVMVIGTQKGRDMKDNLYRNFGWPHPEGYRKALRLMRLADQAGIPILTFIDTPGAYPGIGSEERHIAEAIAVNLREMFNLRVPVISTIIGEGGSGGAIGLGVGNRILIMENAYYSVITPEGCAAILWKDRKFAPQAAEALQITAKKLLELGIADAIVSEPAGGAHRDLDKAAELLGKELDRQLTQLSSMSEQELKDQRYDKFRAFGCFETATIQPDLLENIDDDAE